MPVLLIVKKFNARSKLNGIVVTEKVELKSRDDLTGFIVGVQAANSRRQLDWDLIDYNWAVSDTQNLEVLANPTGGYVGKLNDGEV